ncbi:MAG TPA: zf-TFIIB domain-containing protein [Candidatus Methylomirabilis sp.]|nr:zf-TFIIB domain-containing protein [Candidatus Methylomirabilis sp.]
MPVKPTEKEEEYFARQEFERRKQALAEQASAAAEEERRRVLRVARNRCPRCGASLIAVWYRGVELDKCSTCQGVWLDCGELDQVVEEEKGFLRGLKRIFG